MLNQAGPGLCPPIHEEGKSPSEVSRRDELFVSDSGLISIAGGKLTGFRKMAEKVVDLVAGQLQSETGVIYPPCTTDRVQMSGGDGIDGMSLDTLKSILLEEGERKGLLPNQVEDLISRYGSNTKFILRNYSDLSGQSLSQEDQLLYAKVKYCVEHEMTVSVVDFLLRRTGWMLFDRSRAEQKCEQVMTFMAGQLGWGEPRIGRE